MYLYSSQKVDITYDPGVLKFDARFAVHSSVGSILHELNCNHDDTPLMTTPTSKKFPMNDDISCGNPTDSESEQSKCDDSGADSLKDSKNNVNLDEISGEQQSNEENEDSCSVLSPVSVHIQVCSNDSNTSGDSKGTPPLRQSCGDAGYVTETIGNWNNSTRSEKTPSNYKPTTQEGLHESHVLCAQDYRADSVFEFQSQLVEDTVEKERDYSRRGYVYDSTSQSTNSPCKVEPDSVLESRERVSTENKSLGSSVTANSNTGIWSPVQGSRSLEQQRHVQLQRTEQHIQHNEQSTHDAKQKQLHQKPHKLSHLQEQKTHKHAHSLNQQQQQQQHLTESTVSLNVITELEQAFPPMSSLTLENGLEHNYYPTPGITFSVPTDCQLKTDLFASDIDSHRRPQIYDDRAVDTSNVYPTHSTTTQFHTMTTPPNTSTNYIHYRDSTAASVGTKTTDLQPIPTTQESPIETDHETLHYEDTQAHMTECYLEAPDSRKLETTYLNTSSLSVAAFSFECDDDNNDDGKDLYQMHDEAEGTRQPSGGFRNILFSLNTNPEHDN